MINEIAIFFRYLKFPFVIWTKIKNVLVRLKILALLSSSYFCNFVIHIIGKAVLIDCLKNGVQLPQSRRPQLGQMVFAQNSPARMKASYR